MTSTTPVKPSAQAIRILTMRELIVYGNEFSDVAELKEFARKYKSAVFGYPDVDEFETYESMKHEDGFDDDMFFSYYSNFGGVPSDIITLYEAYAGRHDSTEAMVQYWVDNEDEALLFLLDIESFNTINSYLKVDVGQLAHDLEQGGNYTHDSDTDIVWNNNC